MGIKLFLNTKNQNWTKFYMVHLNSLSGYQGSIFLFIAKWFVHSGFFLFLSFFQTRKCISHRFENVLSTESTFKFTKPNVNLFGVHSMSMRYLVHCNK